MELNELLCKLKEFKNKALNKKNQYRAMSLWYMIEPEIETGYKSRIYNEWNSYILTNNPKNFIKYIEKYIEVVTEKVKQSE